MQRFPAHPYQSKKYLRKITLMRIITVIARLLLGVIFFVFGLNGFLGFIPMPPLEGAAGAFIGSLASSHYLYLVAGVQLIAGVLLLINRFVPLALAMLAPMIASDLDLSVNTVAVHRANIMNALGLHKTAELVVYAIRNGLVNLP